ncbi:DUF4176 domain-containing protein [Clostridium cylindrosporum]|uniref:DUF4176 domain-containing protein n=1 Tax=Clostridium cylindrosporum DSM 605 TaxID=1121307 RepID=A0A0J8D698_CLOCY|nr:DUF4176 domain-containing protein [Clostridium cylindrosporum]KMT21377.1 hypothetical protein CLCY_2c01370 [Clostridium cylindrosporum DSM 605]
MEKELPIGSIVLLNNNKRVMICGKEGKERGGCRIYDYIGCDYPQGYLTDDRATLFNYKDIKSIISIGAKRKKG